MASVRFEYVTKRFGRVIAVQDLNLTVNDQEFLVFVGPSGCGKTTSLRMLAGLEEVTEGNLYIGDRRVNDIPSKDRDIAMVFQSYALYPHMSVFENMAFSLELQGKSRGEIRTRVERAAQQMGITELLHRKPKELSGGQRQRVAVGRAIVRNPSVFLMDEPLSNLDAKLRVQARTEILRLHQDLGTTFIYVTHDQVEAMTMGTRIAVMNHGILQQIDTPQALYHAPQNRFVAGFMGSPAMNFFPVTLIEQDGALEWVSESLRLPVPSDRTAAYAPYRGRSLILGIRPEAIHDPAYVPPDIDAAIVSATVTVVEPMGHEVILYLTLSNGQEFVARVDRRSRLAVGKVVPMILDLQSIHLFEPETDQRIFVEREGDRSGSLR